MCNVRCLLRNRDWFNYLQLMIFPLGNLKESSAHSIFDWPKKSQFFPSNLLPHSNILCSLTLSFGLHLFGNWQRRHLTTVTQTKQYEPLKKLSLASSGAICKTRVSSGRLGGTDTPAQCLIQFPQTPKVFTQPFLCRPSSLSPWELK